MKQIAKHTLEALARRNGEEPVRFFGPILRFEIRDVACEIFSILEKPLRALLEARKTLDRRLLEHLDREERDEADHRTDAKRHLAPVREELVVVKAVLLVPQA